MKAVALMVVALLIAGCATIQHPNSPGVQYASMDQCIDQHSPGACAKVLHKEATKEAVGVGASLLVILTYFGLIALILAGHR